MWQAVPRSLPRSNLPPPIILPHPRSRPELPIAPPLVDSSKGPHQVSRVHWPTQGNRFFFCTFCIFLAPHLWISRSPHFWIYRPPDFQIARFPDSQISRFPDFQTPPAAPPDELSDPNLTPLPTHPGIKYVARTLAATNTSQEAVAAIFLTQH